MRLARPLRSALFAALVAGACGDPTGGDPPGDAPTPILFYSDRNGFSGLHLMSEDGRRVVALEGLGEFAQSGDWSPDGRRIVYSRLSVQPDFQLWLANADGSAPTQLTSSPGVSRAARWSPDGRTIAYWTNEIPTNWGIYAIGVDGSEKRRLPNTAYAHTGHDWSPDGTRIVFMDDDAFPVPGTSEYRFVANLWAADTAGTSLVRLTNNTQCNILGPDWSPDGTRIAFSWCAGSTWKIFTIAADGTGLRQVTSGEGADYFPSWSPDSRRLLFSREIGTSADVWVVNTDGTGLRNLTANNPGYDGDPRWGPAGAPPR